MNSQKKIYFLSDAHLGSLAFTDNADRERKLVNWLRSIEGDCSDLYLLGDIFDFWYEYKHVVPKGFVRFLGQLAQMSDQGIQIHFFIGNHDIWVRDYFEKELGAKVYLDASIQEIQGKTFYLAHGDRSGYRPFAVRLMQAVFHSRWIRVLYSTIHPYFNYSFGLRWSKNNRLYKHQQAEAHYLGEDKEHLVIFSKEMAQQHPEIDFFVFGHRHVMLDLQITRNARVVYLGDWISHFSYGVLDENGFRLESILEE